jgi:M3 family oligoendopeptidase
MEKSFDEFTYVRPDMGAESAAFRKLLGDFAAAPSAEAQIEVMERITAIRTRLASMFSIATIRHTCNTEDPFYEKENDFVDEAKPRVEGLESELYAALLSSPHRTGLERAWGRQIFRIAELKARIYKPEIEPDLAAENRLASEYEKLKASAKIQFEGAERNLSEMQPFMESPDRAIRKRAVSAISAFYAERQGEFDRIYDELVRIRVGIAGKLGFDGFASLGYARLGRSDYDAKAVAAYRRQVLETVVPLAASLRARQAARLGLGSLAYCDEAFEFPSGNPKPKGDTETLVETAGRMYDEMSPQTGEFFRTMKARRLFDLPTRKGKAMGGYCDCIPSEGAPFIFANSNGTSEDVDTLTHEAGHAFQVSRSLGFPFQEYYWPTLEACEIHSMSMEFFAWPWMEGFFGTDAAKYRFRHLTAGILFLPYGVAVDEFQHWVYDRPQATPAERRAAWRGIERRYLRWRDYEEDSFLEAGGYWFRQGHIFQDPFYYIDYTLAQVCAYEFWDRSRSDRASAWKSYLALCDQGGSKSFLELLGVAGLRNPFEPGSIAAIMAPAKAWLDGADDRFL